MLPSLDEFLERDFPTNSYVRFPGFRQLYIRKADIAITLVSRRYLRCREVVTIANVIARRPGKGAFKTLVAYLILNGKAVFVENVHNPRFRTKLLEWGYTRVNVDTGYHYLFNYEGHFEKIEASPTPTQKPTS
jgi:hypothetical protein